MLRSLAALVACAVATRVRQPVTTRGTLVRWKVGANLVFEAEPMKVAFAPTLTWTSYSGAVVANVGGLFTIFGAYSETGRNRGTLTIDSITHSKSAASETKAMLRGWKEGTELDVVWAFASTLISKDDVEFTFSKGKVEGVEHGELLGCKIGGDAVSFVKDEYKSLWVRTGGGTVKMSVAGVFSIFGTFQRRGQNHGVLTVTMALFADGATSSDGPMLEGVKRWDKGVVLEVSSTVRGARVVGEGLELEFGFSEKVLESGELLNCMIGNDFVYLKDPSKRQKFGLSWEESAVGHAVTTRIDGLCTITGVYTAEDSRRGALRVTTVVFDDIDEAGEAGVDAMLAGIKREWQRDRYLRVTVWATRFTIRGGNVELEFRKSAEKYRVAVEISAKRGTFGPRPKVLVKEGWRTHYTTNDEINSASILLNDIAPGAAFAAEFDDKSGISCGYEAGSPKVTCTLASWVVEFSTIPAEQTWWGEVTDDNAIHVT